MSDADDFFDSLPREQPRWQAAYYAAYRRITSIRRVPRWFRSKVQRANRGWSDEDTWSFDHYLSGVIAGGVARLRKDAHGYPEGESPESWDRILGEIVEGFELLAKDEYSNGLAPSGEEKVKIDRAFDHLRTYYTALWD